MIGKRMEKTGGTGGVTGRHVLFALIGFFALIFAVNGVFMYFAVSTHTGTSGANAYQRGLDYNRRISAGAQQTALGWQTKLVLAQDAGALVLKITDRGGFPVPSLQVRGTLGRPATTKFDRKLELRETAPGQYEARLNELAPGSWIADVEAAEFVNDRKKVVYRQRERLWLKPK